MIIYYICPFQRERELVDLELPVQKGVVMHLVSLINVVFFYIFYELSCVNSCGNLCSKANLLLSSKLSLLALTKRLILLLVF